MLYIINSKPYIKVAYYYKEVEVIKNKNGYVVKPKGGDETRIEVQKAKNVKYISIEEYMKPKGKRIIDIDEID